MVGERVDHDGGVLAGLDDLVEVADRALAHGPGQRAVDPRGLAALEQEAPDEVGGRQVVVARDGDERPLEVVGHGLDEARLAAAGRALEHHRQALAEGRLEDLLLVADGHVVRPRRARVMRSSSRSRGARACVRLRWNTRRWASAERSAARNSGPISAGQLLRPRHRGVGRGAEHTPQGRGLGVGADAEAEAPDARGGGPRRARAGRRPRRSAPRSRGRRRSRRRARRAAAVASRRAPRGSRCRGGWRRRAACRRRGRGRRGAGATSPSRWSSKRLDPQQLHRLPAAAS